MQRYNYWCSFTFLLLIYSVKQHTVSGQPNSDVHVTARVSDTVVLPCQVRFSGQVLQVAWLDNAERVISRNTEVLHDTNRYSVIHQYAQEWNLEIRNVRRRDQGDYTCSVFISANQREDTDVYLDVHYPPEITLRDSSPQVITLNQGDDYDLVCMAVGNPPPVITWYKYAPNGQKQELARDQQMLVLRSVGQEESGSYECEANNNIIPSDKMGIKVNVNFAPVIELPHVQIRQLLGRSTLLECIVIASSLDLAIYWQRASDGLILQSSDKYQVRTWEVGEYRRTLAAEIYNLEESDYTDYMCVANSSYGITNATMTLYEWRTGELRVVRQPPGRALAKVGQSMTLPCQVEGQGKRDVVSWWYNGVMIFSSKQVTDTFEGPLVVLDTRLYEIEGHYSLHIHNITLTSAGVYMCDVSGKVNYTSQLTVMESVECSNDNDSLTLGDVATLSCTARYNGSAMPIQVDWIRPKTGLQMSSINHDERQRIHRQLVLHKVHSTDAGQYICRVRGSQYQPYGTRNRMFSPLITKQDDTCAVLLSIEGALNSSDSGTLPHQGNYSGGADDWTHTGSTMSSYMAVGLMFASLVALTLMFATVLCSVVRHYRNKLALYRPVSTSNPDKERPQCNNGDTKTKLLGLTRVPDYNTGDPEDEIDTDTDV